VPTVPIRVHADTSVYGGVLDEEFKSASTEFFNQVRNGRFQLIVSAVVDDELRGAPSEIKSFFEQVRTLADVVDVTEEAIGLQQAYLEAHVLSSKWETDALHVALATVSQARIIVSWNFQHIVHFQKIPLYNGINQASGYAPIAFHSPAEMIVDENQDI